MIVSLEGAMGSSKTTGAVMLAYYEHYYNGRKIMSNFPLNFPYTPFTLKYLKEHWADGEIVDYLILIDEAQQLVDGRSSGSPVNKDLSYFLKDARHRHNDLFIITQVLGDVDKRFRQALDVRISCSYSEINCRFCKGTGMVNGNICEECLGYHSKVNRNNPSTIIGHSVMNLWQRHRGLYYFLGKPMTRRRAVLHYTPNEFWALFNTEQRMPIRKALLERLDVEELEVAV